MTAPYRAAFDEIERFVTGILPGAEMARVGYENLHVRTGAHIIQLSFNPSQLDDFEATLTGQQPVRYSKGIRSDLFMRIYEALGLEGMIPDVCISAVLINEERDWLPACRVNGTRFESASAKRLYDGLLELQTSLRSALVADVEIPDIQLESDVIGALTRFYDQHGHLDSPDVGRDSLSYLKAAALVWILQLEDDKIRSHSPRVKLAYDKKIYGVVHQFWIAQPYNRIELPPAVHDYISSRQVTAPTLRPAHRSHVDIGPDLARVDVRLRDRWRGAWAALRSDNPDRVSQASNSMVEVLDQVIDRARGTKEFKDYLADRFPEQGGVVLATRKWIAEVKTSLQGVKHHTRVQSPQLAEDLMHQAEWIVHLLLRR